MLGGVGDRADLAQVFGDRFQRRTTSMVISTIVPALMLVFAFTGSYWTLVISGFLASLFGERTRSRSLEEFGENVPCAPFS